MEYIAFISHSNKDAKALHTVREHLESLGYSCFASERDLYHNASWQAQLVEAMDASRMLVYIHSKNSNESAEVGREINYFADKCHRPILVYRLDDIPYNRDRAYYLQSINYIDSLVSPSDGLEQLAINVKLTIEGQVAEGYDRNPGKALIFVRRMAVPLIVLALLICGGIGFHLWEKGRVNRFMDEGAALLSSVEGWLTREDSLELVFPGIDKAEVLYGKCSGMLTVKAQDPPDFQKIRNDSRQALEEIRERRVNTVKALYEPLRYASKNNVAASSAIIMSNIEKIALLDSLLGLPRDSEINSIFNQINQ